jgi:transposase
LQEKFQTTQSQLGIHWKSTLFYLRSLKRMHPKFVLFWDKATLHTDWRVEKYLKENESCIRVEHFPTVTPELNPVEECWRQTKGNEILANKIHLPLMTFIRQLQIFTKGKDLI